MTWDEIQAVWRKRAGDAAKRRGKTSDTGEPASEGERGEPAGPVQEEQGMSQAPDDPGASHE